MRRPLTLAAVVLLIAALTTPTATAQEGGEGRYRQDGDVGGFANVMPPGQAGVLNTGELLPGLAGTYPEHYNDQTPLYESLVYEGGLPSDDAPHLGITDGDLARFFKDGSFGTDEDVEPIALPAACGEGVVAFRDVEFGVPHIYGDTREAAQCANGYITASDRLFLMDVLRHTGRARMSEFLGASEGNKAMDREQLLVAPYTEEDLTAQADALCGADDAERQRICADGTAYTEGVNAYIAEAQTDPTLLPGEYVALQLTPEEFVLEDIIATASLVGGIFGKGGGAEAANSMFMAALQAQHGPEEGRAIFDDLKAADDPDASLTIQTPFPYGDHDAIDDSTTALLEPGSFVGAFGDDAAGGGTGLPGLGDVPLLGEALEDLLGDLLPVTTPTSLQGGAGEDVAEAEVGWPAETAGATANLGIADGPFGPIDLRTPLAMSNAILAGADVSDGGVPIAVFGPQTGYYTPQLLVETDIHAPGLDARGVAFAGTNIYVQLGRGRDYAWSATSASGDMVDEWALELCDPAGGEATIDSTGYVWDGECTEIPVLTHTQVAKPSLGGIPESPSPDNIVYTLEVGRIPELGNGPVVGRAMTTDGVPVAIAEQRSTLGDELGSAVGFGRINDPDFMTDGVESFNRAFDGVDFTFNWFYVDETDIAYRHTCLCPQRDPDTDPDLLTWGGRGHQWTGEFLSPAEQPQAVNPESGFFANWNNRQAPGFRSQDDSFKHHSTDRREHLAVRMEAAIASGDPLTAADMVNIAEDAGTVDLNGQEIYPLALEVMGDAPPASLAGDERLVEMRDRLADWVLDDRRPWGLATGGHRRDVDADGTYDHAVAIAIGDAWVRPMIEGVLGDEVPLDAWPEGTEDHPRLGLGSAYNSGRIRFVHEDLLQILGRPVLAERSRTYCGDGTVDGCAAVLWHALADAAALLESTPDGGEACDFPTAYQFDTPEVEGWVYDSTCDEIIQVAGGVVSAPSMQWVNRPTFHQVVQAGTRSGRIDGPDRVATAAALSRHAFAGGAETVVLAAAGTFADAVAGAPLAASRQAPLLLTAPDGLSGATAHEIARLGATDAVVLGGTAAISDAVVDELEAAGLSVERVAGEDRFATAVAIADALGQTERVVVADGGDFPDALAAGPFAVADDRAILLVSTDAGPASVAAALAAAAAVGRAGG
ncbi:penicillin acylase family protein, partial [Euzebya sp.]|uniref:penicillin acylase family protein n=1 Tax=Euzebya sp. TaxID=1971409 RepID=UPI0035186A53